MYDCIIEKQIPVCLLKAVFEEYESALARPKFARFPNFYFNAKVLLPRLKRVAKFYEPSIKLEVIKDEADNRFLKLAVAANANIILSGNTKHFNFPEYEGIQIVVPEFFYESYCK